MCLFWDHNETLRMRLVRTEFTAERAHAVFVIMLEGNWQMNSLLYWSITLY